MPPVRLIPPPQNPTLILVHTGFARTTSAYWSNLPLPWATPVIHFVYFKSWVPSLISVLFCTHGFFFRGHYLYILRGDKNHRKHIPSLESILLYNNYSFSGILWIDNQLISSFDCKVWLQVSIFKLLIFREFFYFKQWSSWGKRSTVQNLTCVHLIHIAKLFEIASICSDANVVCVRSGAPHVEPLHQKGLVRWTGRSYRSCYPGTPSTMLS